MQRTRWRGPLIWVVRCLMTEVVETYWWLDSSALPDRLLWARLRIFSDGSAEILDLDGRSHRFGDRGRAKLWLLEDAYCLLADLIEGGDVGIDAVPPQAENDGASAPWMRTKRETDL